MHPYVLMAAGTASFFAGMDPAWIAFLGATFGGVGLKVVESWLSKGRVKIDDASTIRNEMRQEITSQRTEIKELETERDGWREKYWAAQDKILALRGMLIKNNVDPDE